MDEDFNEIIDELTGDGDGPPAPTWRATIRGRRLTLTAWAPFLITNGPLGNLMPGREADGITIADLTVHGEDEDELSVRFYALGTTIERAEAVLIEWATRVGYRRLWLPDRLVPIEPEPEQLGTASVRCPTCRARWQDGSPEFWLLVKGGGTFPKWCPMCGCELPQWTVRPARSGDTPTGRPAGWHSSERRAPSRPKSR